MIAMYRTPGLGRALATTQRGFTLMEILIVLALIAVISTFVIGNVMGGFSSGQAKAARAQLSTVSTAIDRFYLDNGSYPERLDDLITKPGSAPNWGGPYLKASQVKDPWQEPLQYKVPGDHGDYDLWSHGKDKRAGGEGDSADIKSWE
jgi:general secretion pathway protein G